MANSREKSSGLPRRDFLALGPAFGLATGMLHLSSLSKAALSSPFAGLEPARDDLLSIGYWQGSDTLAEFARLTHTGEPFFVDAQHSPVDESAIAEPVPADVISAQALSVGDRRFAQNGAKVSIHGLFPTVGEEVHDLPGLSIDVHFDPYHRAPFRAWQFDPSASSRSPAGVSFTVPLEKTTGLTLWFTIAEGRDQRSGADASPERISTRFSLGREPGQPKLRRGVYFIAWRGSNSKPLPSWRRYLVLAAAAKTGDLPEDEITHEGYSRLTRRWNELAPADLTYVMLSVDYAAGSGTEWI